MKILLFPEHEVFRDLPENLKENDIALIEKEIKKVIPPSYLYVFSKAWVVNYLIVKPKFLRVIGSERIHVIKKIKILISFFLKFKKKQIKTLDRAIWICDLYSINYFHWITDALTKLTAVRLHAKENITVLLPSSFKDYPFITQSLDMLNYPYFFFDHMIKIETLYLPTPTAPMGNYNEHYINVLQNSFNLKLSERPHRKIFISRKKSVRRKILNSEAVEILLKNLGFEIYCMEDLSFYEQTLLMSETKVLAGLHGAGLTNMLFMPQNGIVIELRIENDTHNNCYFSLASALKHKYFYLQNKSTKMTTFDADIMVNIDELKSLVLSINKLIEE